MHLVGSSVLFYLIDDARSNKNPTNWFRVRNCILILLLKLWIVGIVVLIFDEISYPVSSLNWFANRLKLNQDKQSSYDVTARRVRVTTVVVEKQ